MNLVCVKCGCQAIEPDSGSCPGCSAPLVEFRCLTPIVYLEEGGQDPVLQFDMTAQPGRLTLDRRIRCKQAGAEQIRRPAQVQGTRLHFNLDRVPGPVTGRIEERLPEEQVWVPRAGGGFEVLLYDKPRLKAELETDWIGPTSAWRLPLKLSLENPSASVAELSSVALRTSNGFVAQLGLESDQSVRLDRDNPRQVLHLSILEQARHPQSLQDLVGILYLKNEDPLSLPLNGELAICMPREPTVFRNEWGESGYCWRPLNDSEESCRFRADQDGRTPRLSVRTLPSTGCTNEKLVEHSAILRARFTGADGSVVDEIRLGGEKPQKGNWTPGEVVFEFPLPPDLPSGARLEVIAIDCHGEEIDARRYDAQLELEELTAAEDYPYHVAIDLGSSNSCLAMMPGAELDPKQEVISFPLDESPEPGEDRSADIVPTWIWGLSDDQVPQTWGIRAERRLAEDNPDTLRSGLKRRLLDTPDLPVPGLEDHLPDEALALFVTEMLERARAYLAQRSIEHRRLRKLMVGVPIMYPPREKKKIRAACLRALHRAEIAHVDVRVEIVDESVAVLCELYRRSEMSDIPLVMVWDFGAETTDVSLASVKKENLRLLSAGGSMNLGGRRVDDLIATLLRELWQESASPKREEMLTYLDSNVEAQRIKHSLANEEEAASFTVLDLAPDSPPRETLLRLRQAVLDELRPEVCDVARDALSMKRAEPELSGDEEVRLKVFLAGNASRLHGFRELVEECVEEVLREVTNNESVKVSCDLLAEPKRALCKGAHHYAAFGMAGGWLEQLATFSLELQVWEAMAEGGRLPLLERGDDLPHERLIPIKKIRPKWPPAGEKVPFRVIETMGLGSGRPTSLELKYEGETHLRFSVQVDGTWTIDFANPEESTP